MFKAGYDPIPALTPKHSEYWIAFAQCMIGGIWILAELSLKWVEIDECRGFGRHGSHCPYNISHEVSHYLSSCVDIQQSVLAIYASNLCFPRLELSKMEILKQIAVILIYSLRS